MEAYSAELQQLHTVFSHLDAGLPSSGGVEAESVLRRAEDLLDDLQEKAELLAGDKVENVNSGQTEWAGAREALC